MSCGTTHTAVVPLDLVKCRMQVCLSHGAVSVFRLLLIHHNRYDGVVVLFLWEYTNLHGRNGVDPIVKLFLSVY